MAATVPPTLCAQDLTQPDGTVALDKLLDALHLTKADLAKALGMSRDTLSRTSLLTARTTQSKLKDFVEILIRAAPWAGSIPQAFAWFSAQPLSSFGDQTAAELVREGRADAVKSYISRITVGGYPIRMGKGAKPAGWPPHT